MDFIERVKGIEPSLRAWEARVLPLNYTRDRCPRVLAATGIWPGPKYHVSSETRPQTAMISPTIHQESDSPRPVLRPLDSFRHLAPLVFPPCDPVAHQERKTKAKDQLGEEVFNVQKVGHGCDANSA